MIVLQHHIDKLNTFLQKLENFRNKKSNEPFLHVAKALEENIQLNLNNCTPYDPNLLPLPINIKDKNKEEAICDSLLQVSQNSFKVFCKVQLATRATQENFAKTTPASMFFSCSFDFDEIKLLEREAKLLLRALHYNALEICELYVFRVDIYRFIQADESRKSSDFAIPMSHRKSAISFLLSSYCMKDLLTHEICDAIQIDLESLINYCIGSKSDPEFFDTLLSHRQHLIDLHSLMLNSTTTSAMTIG